MTFKQWFLAVLFISLVGCAPSLKITSEYVDDSYSFGSIPQESMFKIYSSDNLTLSGFRMTFEREFGSAQNFAAILGNQIKDSIALRFLSPASLSTEPSENTMFISGSYDQNSITQMQSVFEKAAENYFLVVKQVTIAGKSTASAPMFIANGTGGGMMVGGGNSEQCYVTIDSELWNVKARKKVLSFSSTAESTVNFFMYGTALKSAVGKSIRYMLNYIATGVSK